MSRLQIPAAKEMRNAGVGFASGFGVMVFRVQLSCGEHYQQIVTGFRQRHGHSILSAGKTHKAVILLRVHFEFYDLESISSDLSPGLYESTASRIVCVALSLWYGSLPAHVMLQYAGYLDGAVGSLFILENGNNCSLSGDQCAIQSVDVFGWSVCLLSVAHL